ncbi:hypothetical protein [Haloarchaeobius sp. DFWS5]|uniref:hypothetical protein n=1 Tax=Haloarchaeobius sp. DFWS5 TaxID=3446114 RepID=UPI003EB7E720
MIELLVTLFVALVLIGVVVVGAAALGLVSLGEFFRGRTEGAADPSDLKDLDEFDDTAN